MKVYLVTRMAEDGPDKIPDSVWSTSEAAVDRVGVLHGLGYASQHQLPVEFEVDPS